MEAEVIWLNLRHLTVQQINKSEIWDQKGEASICYLCPMDEIYIQGNLRNIPFFLIRYQLGLTTAFLKTFLIFKFSFLTENERQ